MSALGGWWEVFATMAGNLPGASYLGCGGSSNMTMDSMKDFQQETRETVKYDQGASDLAIAMHGSPLDLEHFLVLTYVASKMAGEAGEVAQELGKYVRGDFGEKE